MTLPAGYGRRSGDYNPLFHNQDLPVGPTVPSVQAAQQCGGPRPLEWHVGASKTAGGAHQPVTHAAQWENGVCSAHGSWLPGMLQQQTTPAVESRGESYAVAQQASTRTARGSPGPSSAGFIAGEAESIVGFSGLGVGYNPAFKSSFPTGSEVNSTTATVAPASQVVLGPGIAGYKSVITKNPVSPSGYSLAPAPVAASTLSSNSNPAVYHPAKRVSGGYPAESGYMPSAAVEALCCSSSRPAVSGSSATASAAAAAALAALGGRSKAVLQAHPPSASTGDGTGGSYNSCRMPEFSIADAAAAAGIDDSRLRCGSQRLTPAPAGLKWNVQEQPSQQQALAGRRADARSPSKSSRGISAATEAGFASAASVAYTPVDSSVYTQSSRNEAQQQQQQRQYSPSSYTDSSRGDSAAAGGARPPSQQLSEGLSKLKQLSTARLASRLTTPPSASVTQRCAVDSGSTVPAGSSRSIGSGRRTSGSAQAMSDGASDYGSTRICTGAGPQQQHQQQPVSSSNSTYVPSTYSGGSVRRTNSRGQSAAGTLPATAGAQQQMLSRGGSERSSRSEAVSGFQDQNPGMQPSYEGFGGVHNAARQPDEYAPQGVLRQCPNCGRSFIPSALERHVKVCEKVFCQKRKIFNTQSQRLQGSEAAKHAPKSGDGSSSSSGIIRTRPGSSGRKPGSSKGQRQQQQQQQLRPGMTAGTGAIGPGSTRQPFDSRPAMSASEAKKSKWQQQSEQLRAAMRANHSGGGGAAARGGGMGSYAPAPVEDNRIPCPHCGRRFAELAAERHIPKCREIIAKPTGLKAGGGKAAYMRSNSRK